MIVVLDNRDSFVYNLARCLRLAGAKNVCVVRSSSITLKELEDMNPLALILSPGPGRPQEDDICIQAVRTLGPHIPILGVCLGHQAITVAYSGHVTQAIEPMHGRALPIIHDDSALFTGIPSPFLAGRYHSLIAHVPPMLKVNAWSAHGEVMAFSHTHHPVWGVQFHPESLLTPDGLRILSNFIEFIH